MTFDQTALLHVPLHRFSELPPLAHEAEKVSLSQIFFIASGKKGSAAEQQLTRHNFSRNVDSTDVFSSRARVATWEA